MKLDKEQKANVEVGRGMVYVGKNGAERYLENSIDIYGGVAKGAENQFYVWKGDDLDEIHDTMLGGRWGLDVLPFNSLDEAKAYVDSLHE